MCGNFILLYSYWFKTEENMQYFFNILPIVSQLQAKKNGFQFSYT